MKMSWVFSIALAAVCGTGFGAGDVPRPKHPRPQFVRADWQSLNGRGALTD